MFAIFDDTSPVVEGLSIDEAFIDVRGMERIAGRAGGDRRAAARAGARRRSGCRSRSGSRARSSWPRSPRRRRSRTGCWSCRPTGSSSSCTRCRSRRCGAWGKVTAGKLHARGITDRRAGGASCRRTTLVGLLGKASGRQLHALAHKRDPRRVTTGVRRRSIGGQRAIGRRGPEDARGAGRDAGRAGRPDRPAAARGAAASCRTVILRLRFDDFSRATRSQTLAEATATARPLLAARARAARGRRCRSIEREGVTLVGLSLTNLEDADAVAARAPARRDEDARAGRGGGRRARPLRPAADHARRARRPRPGHRDAAAADMIEDRS